MIHYHGSPLSGDHRTAVRALSGKHAMVSFADAKQIEIAAEVCQSFCVDNGAFTAWKQGADFDMDGYVEFVLKWHKHPGFDWYVIPDAIDATVDENRAMRAKWRNIIPTGLWSLGVPVWHLHEPLDELQYLCLAYSRVALGSSGEYATVGNGKWWSRMADVMRVACDVDGKPRAKLHGLRMLDPTIFSHIPLSSADSTNVARNIGIDSAWNGTYQPKTKETRAAVLMERIEAHGSASRWSGAETGAMPNMELFG